MSDGSEAKQAEPTMDRIETLKVYLPTTNLTKYQQELAILMLKRFIHLLDKGFLAPTYVDKLIKSPMELMKFSRQNRRIVGDMLDRRLAIYYTKEKFMQTRVIKILRLKFKDCI